MSQVAPSISAAPVVSLSLSLLPSDQCVDCDGRVRCDAFLPKRALGASARLVDANEAGTAAVTHPVVVSEKDVPEFIAPIRPAEAAAPPS